MKRNRIFGILRFEPLVFAVPSGLILSQDLKIKDFPFQFRELQGKEEKRRFGSGVVHGAGGGGVGGMCLWDQLRAVGSQRR